MKSPRELLLKRHEAATPKLDALRAEALASLPARSQLSTLNSQPLSLWERLLGPNPLAWAGLAAVWVLLFAINRSGGEPANSVTTASRASQPSEAAVAEIVRERRREMAELLNLDEPQAVAPNRSELHPKRSQRREETAVA